MFSPSGANALLAIAVLPVGMTSSCVYDWTVGKGSGGASSTSTSSASKSATTTGATSTTSTGSDCPSLVTQYRAALLSAKRCVMTDPTGCQLADTDGCGCKVFLDHVSTEATAFDAAKSAVLGAGCSLGCATCGTGPSIGSCDVDAQHGGTSCFP